MPDKSCNRHFPVQDHDKLYITDYLHHATHFRGQAVISGRGTKFNSLLEITLSNINATDSSCGANLIEIRPVKGGESDIAVFMFCM